MICNRKIIATAKVSDQFSDYVLTGELILTQERGGKITPMIVLPSPVEGDMSTVTVLKSFNSPTHHCDDCNQAVNSLTIDFINKNVSADVREAISDDINGDWEYCMVVEFSIIEE